MTCDRRSRKVSRGASMLAFLLFFLSGVAALLYQVVWQRLLVIFSGSDVYSVTVVVAAFMGGLGTGSLLGGVIADRLGPARSLIGFAGAELLVGLFGLFSKYVYYDALYLRYPHLAATPAMAGAVLFITLLFPTFLMGLSLPLLARALSPSLHGATRVLGWLYGLNTLGAATGAFAASWVIIPAVGLERSLWIAAGLNLVCAAGAAYLISSAAATLTQSLDDAVPGAELVPTDARFRFATWALIYGLTGFLAIGLEIAWFRLLGVLLKSTAFTFGTLLAVYLFGLGAGAVVTGTRAGRSRHAGVTFLGLQYGITLYTAASTIVLMAAVGAGYPRRLVAFLASYEPIDVYGTVERILRASWTTPDALGPAASLGLLYVGVPAMLIGPPTLLMGASFPYLQRASQADFARLGRRLGVLLASNVVGGVLGAGIVGLILLPALGTAGTLKLLVGMGAIVGVLFVRAVTPGCGWIGGSAVLAVVAITALSAAAMPEARSLWARLHGTAPERVLFDEDASGLSLLKISPTFGGAEVYVNGLGQSSVPYGNVHTVLGALPAFIHPRPAAMALIGLGSGDTAFGAAGRSDLQRLVSIEILGGQRQTLERYLQVGGYPGLRAVLSDPRVDYRVGDGRVFLTRSSDRFDLIEADALRPSSAFAGNLYSREYFELVSRRLKPGGLAVTWAPTERIRSTFLSVYDHVLAFSGDVWIGSHDPIQFDAEIVRQRLAGAQDYYLAAGVNILELLKPQLESRPRRFGPADRRGSAELNTDLFPRDEFALPFWRSPSTSH